MTRESVSMAMSKNSLLQAAALIGAAFVFAIVANGFASSSRRLMLPGNYPNALRVPELVREPPPPRHSSTSATTTSAAPVTTTMASPGPGQPPITITTIEQPATTTAPAPIATATTTPAKIAATPPPAATTTTTTAAAPPTAPAADPLARFTPHADKAYVEISGEDAALLHSKGVLFLDARRTSVYDDGHIAGARPFSVWEADVDEKVNALFNERSDPREQNLPIVIYCTGGACEDSHMLAEKLWGIQFNNVYVYKDGFPDWQKRGGAVKTGGQS
ncbi:MAG: rhodanese-like domain-containing protein [Acidobacteriota bacterium]|nr:rhodanese-like domain-containing protein [Acidobacteriota bacterium]